MMPAIQIIELRKISNSWLEIKFKLGNYDIQSLDHFDDQGTDIKNVRKFQKSLS
jgi:hypothetical protein